MYTGINQAVSEGGVCEDVRILRFKAVVQKTGMSKSDIYGRIRRKEFPMPVQLGPRSVGFVETEVNRWLSTLIANSRVEVTQ
jgi:prophage regulatory protein